MKSFKLLLTFACAALLFVSAQAAAQTAKYIGYAWPFDDRDIASELGSGPIVLELYTTQACLFCPTADRFFADLIKKAPAVTALSCHVNYLDVSKGSLSLQACTDRQYAYAASIPGGSVYTPQIIINGSKEVFGFQFNKVVELLAAAGKKPLGTLEIVVKGADEFTVTLPEVKASADKSEVVEVLQYRNAVHREIAEGPNSGANIEYNRVVSSINSQTPENLAGVYKFKVTADQDAAGFVVLYRNKAKTIAVGEYKFPAKAD